MIRHQSANGSRQSGDQFFAKAEYVNFKIKARSTGVPWSMAVKQEGLGSPAIIVIGDVVRLSSCKEFINALAIAA